MNLRIADPSGLVAFLHPAASASLAEIFEWEGCVFRIGGDGDGGLQQYGTLEEARDG